MNKNNIQIIKRIVATSNLQNRNNLKKLFINNNYHNKEIEKRCKFNEIMIKKMDYNLNKLILIEKEKELTRQAKKYITNEITHICIISSIITIGILIHYY